MATTHPDPDPTGSEGTGRNRQLTRLTRSQSGLFTFDQALRCGFPAATIHARTASGAWERWLFQVYGRAGLPRTWRRRLLAAVMAAGRGAAAARNSAAVLWDLPTARQDPLEVVVHYTRCVRLDEPSIVVHRSRTLVAEDVVILGSVPTTVLDRTIVELSGQRTVDQLSEMMAHAVRRGEVSAQDLADRERRAGPVRGIRRFRRARARLHPDTARSRAKREIQLTRALVAAGLPRPTVAHRVVDESGQAIAEIDLAYVPERIAIEVDGYVWHSSPWQKRYDTVRQNRLVLHGWRVVRFTSEDIDQRLRWVVREVSRALAIVPHPTDE